MKTKILITAIAIWGITSVCYSQDYSNLKDIVLKDKADYPKVDNQILECAKYILNTPMDDKNLNRFYSLQFMMRWMQGTPDYTFNIDETIGNIIKSNESLLGVYLACMANYMLENKVKAKDEKEVKYNSILLLINYCEASKNNVDMSSELKIMIKAKNENTLKEYLKLQ